ncbi:hypothetical protein ANANG_G00214210, partial [Anguilla anguilla]
EALSPCFVHRIQQSLKSSSFEEKSSDKLSSAKKPPLQEWNSPRRLQSLLRTLMKLEKDNKLERFKSHLRQDFPESFKSLPEEPSWLDKFMTRMKKLFMREQEDPEAVYIVEKMLETCGSERSLKITLHILRKMKQNDLVDSPERDEQHNESIKRAQQELKTHLKKQFECIFEGLAKQGHQTLLNDIYTELYIT